MKAVFLCVLSGVLCALSLPPFDIEWLGWIALAPLLVAGRDRRPLEAMGLGLASGLVCGALHARWHPDTHGLRFAYLPFIWLAMMFAGVAGMSAMARSQWSGMRWVFFAAASGVAAEWLTSFSPLPVNIALFQHRTLSIIQIASLAGIWGVSCLLWLVNAALADAILLKQRWTRSMSVVLAAVLLAFGSSFLQIHSSAKLGPPLRVAAIQDHTGIETAHLLRPVSIEESAADRDEMTRRAAKRGAKLVVWSEGCLGGAFAPDASINPTADLARELQTYLVVGYTEPAQPKSFNAAAIVAPDGTVKGIHRKIHLFLGERLEVQPAKEATAFDTGLGKMGVEICYDTCFTDVTRRIARAGAQIIAMPNYDPPTPYGVLHRLHAAMLPFRAVENRIPFVRSDSNGLSQIIDSTGRIVAQGPLFASDILVSDIPLGDGRGTLYTRWGDWLVYLCLMGLAVCWGYGMRSGTRVQIERPRS